MVSVLKTLPSVSDTWDLLAEQPRVLARELRLDYWKRRGAEGAVADIKATLNLAEKWTIAGFAAGAGIGVAKFSTHDIASSAVALGNEIGSIAADLPNRPRAVLRRSGALLTAMLEGIGHLAQHSQALVDGAIVHRDAFDAGYAWATTLCHVALLSLGTMGMAEGAGTIARGITLSTQASSAAPASAGVAGIAVDGGAVMVGAMRMGLGTGTIAIDPTDGGGEQPVTKIKLDRRARPKLSTQEAMEIRDTLWQHLKELKRMEREERFVKQRDYLRKHEDFLTAEGREVLEGLEGYADPVRAADLRVEVEYLLKEYRGGRLAQRIDDIVEDLHNGGMNDLANEIQQCHESLMQGWHRKSAADIQKLQNDYFVR